MRRADCSRSLLLLLSLLPACSLFHSTGDLLFCTSDELKQRELEHVAKDWCLTLRASQIIPVYPLTEDLQPGDLFLVSVPVDEQHTEYLEKGYLDFDKHVARLDLDYATFYDGSFGIGTNGDTPHHWQFPVPPHTAVPLTDWASAPGAFFPSYSFTVSHGAGAQVALPISTVPVGLGLMSSQSATGTVVLSDARVYGLPLDAFLGPVGIWAAKPMNRDLLQGWAATAGSTDGHAGVYLRAICRVYLIGAVDVSLVSTDSAALGADVGVAPEIEMLESSASDPVSWQKALDAINAGLNRSPAAQAAAEAAADAPTGGAASGAAAGGAASGGPSGAAASGGSGGAAGGAAARLAAAAQGVAPGGAIRITQASRRSITAKETFPRPLVIGYLGFDFPVYAGGRLGAPVTTSSVLDGAVPPATAVLGDFSADQVGTGDVRAKINALPEGQAAPVYAAAAKLVDPDFEKLYQKQVTGLATPTNEQARDAFTKATLSFQVNAAGRFSVADVQHKVHEALAKALHDRAP